MARDFSARAWPCMAAHAVRWLLTVATMLLLFQSTGSAEVKSIAPLRVVDLAVEARHSIEGGCLKVRGVAQANGRWAALMQCAGADSVLVSGDSVSQSSTVLKGTFDKILMTPDRRIILRRSPRPKGGTEAVVVDEWGTFVESLRLPVAAAEPLIANGEVRWKTRDGVHDQHEWPLSQSGLKFPDVNNTVPQAVDVVGLPSGEYFTLGGITEQITLFNKDNAAIGTRKIDLDGAFHEIGLPITKPDVISGRTRIIWAVGSQSGRVYVCLSDTPADGPAYIAVVDPYSGNVTEVIRADLPTTERRKEAPHNRSGTIVPLLASFGDQLVIVDPEMQLAAIYNVPSESK